jgi:hypothetical protein
MIETTDEFIAFYQHRLLAAAAARGMAEQVVRRHLGICLDTCHAAIAFEDPGHALDCLAAEGIPVPKIQLSAALRTAQPAAAREALRAYAEPVYLHQVGARGASGEPLAWADLPNALNDARWDDLAEARVHFHVPLFWGGAGVLQTTAEDLGPGFFARLRNGASPHLEVETYTFQVLPQELRCGTVAESVSREMEWALARLA